MEPSRLGISIVIPAYNEAERILPTFEALAHFLRSHGPQATPSGSHDPSWYISEIVVVDDGSKDNTSEVVAKAWKGWASEFGGLQTKLLRLESNQGKGAATRKGMLESTGDFALFMDADCSTDLAMTDRLFQTYQAQQPARAETIVIGSRDIAGAEIVKHQNFFREYAAKGFNLWIQLWLLPGVWDTQCGFKLFPRGVVTSLFAPLQEPRFGFDIEVLYRARRLGYPIQEAPVRWKDVAQSRVRPLKDGLSMAWQVVRLRFVVSRHLA